MISVPRMRGWKSELIERGGRTNGLLKWVRRSAREIGCSGRVKGKLVREGKKKERGARVQSVRRRMRRGGHGGGGSIDPEPIQRRRVRHHREARAVHARRQPDYYTRPRKERVIAATRTSARGGPPSAG